MLIRAAIVSLLAAAIGQSAPVLRAHVDNQPITPVTARYLVRSIEEAGRLNSPLLLIVLDTPGGLVDSTREIVKAILASKTPIAVYVSPAGARAASAGVFITMAAHIAAMTPGTNIGAAHPVQIGGFPTAPQPPDASSKKEKQTAPMEDKIVNDTVAWVESLAHLRGRNAEWAARTVRESISASAGEALRDKAIDLIADSESALLTQLNGRKVTMPSGDITLQTTGVPIQNFPMWWGERLLTALANPTLAFLLLMFGFYGIIFELNSPGWGVGGTVGIICLILGFFALAVLPVNYVGLALIGIALALFVSEAFVPSHGLLTVGGIICLFLGGIMLVDSPSGFERVSLSVLIPVCLATATISGFLFTRIIVAFRQPTQTGGEALVGAIAVADGSFSDTGPCFTGLVRVHGEFWRAVSGQPVAAGDAVTIQSRDGLTLHVSPQNK